MEPKSYFSLFRSRSERRIWPMCLISSRGQADNLGEISVVTAAAACSGCHTSRFLWCPYTYPRGLKKHRFFLLSWSEPWQKFASSFRFNCRYSQTCPNPYPSVDASSYGLVEVMGYQRCLTKHPKNTIYFWVLGFAHLGGHAPSTHIFNTTTPTIPPK